MLERSQACPDENRIDEFVRGRLPAVDQAMVEGHMAMCGGCRALLAMLARTSAVTQATTLGVGVGGGADAGGDSQVLLPGGRVGRYVIRDVLAAGGMGVVFIASDPALDRDVALKLLRPHLAATGAAAAAHLDDRLIREAQAMARLAHPNVVAVHDAGRIGDQVFIAMELVAGSTLKDWLQDAPRSSREILAAFSAAGRGLAAAHAAGILHRDFKPENVLVGRDGRVRVTDFGLARSLERDDRVAGALGLGSQALALRLTASGALVGTPRYMAPEQFCGEPTDARSDQFSFCVALWEALYGECPFPGRNLEELSESVLGGALRDPPRGGTVPARVRRALRRGLALAADQRHASMEDLLAELAVEPRRPRAAWIAGPIAVALTAGVVAALFARGGGQERQLCTGAAARFASVWNPRRAGEMKRAFAATHLPYGPDAASSVASVLDGYQARWVAMHTEACRATRVRGEQPEKVLELRMVCLEERLKDVRALVELYARADPAVVETSVAAAYRLADVAACADLPALTAVLPPPSDPAVAVHVSELRDRLARARAHKESGKFAEGIALARPAASAARSIGYRPLEAEALLVEGELEQRSGDRAAAEATLMQAIYAAEAGKHDLVAASAWTTLVFLVGYEDARYARGIELARHATAAIERLGGNGPIEGNLEKALGAIDADQGHDQEAIRHFERAVSLFERALGPDHPSVITAVDNLGMALAAQGQRDRALELHRRALAARERTLGGQHPAIARSLENLGNDLEARGDSRQAEELHRRALAILERTVGPEDPEVATVLTDLGNSLRSQGRLAEALEIHQRGLALGEKVFGPENPTFAAQLVNTGTLLKLLGRLDEALAHQRRAAAIYAKLLGPDHPRVAYTWLTMGDVHLERGHPRQALAEYRRALPILEKARGEGHPEVTSALISIGQAELALGHPGRAIEPLERALAALVPSDAPSDRGATRFLLARALWEARRDRAQARSLAAAARDDYARSGTGFAAQLAEVDRWLAGRAARPR